jgi:hypothetical protein
MRNIIVLLLFTFSLPASAEWVSVNKVDAFTDKKVMYAVYSDENHRVQISRQGTAVWMFVTRKKIGTFEPNTLIELRVDKNKVLEFDPPVMNKILAASGLKAYQWEPATIGFLIWSGQEDVGCGYIGQFMSGEKLSVRYQTNTMERDSFSINLAGAKKALIDGLDLKICGK